MKKIFIYLNILLLLVLYTSALAAESKTEKHTVKKSSKQPIKISEKKSHKAIAINKIDDSQINSELKINNHKPSIRAEFPAISSADFYFLMDYDTKEVLLQKNADTRLAPSSMTKIMTAYVVFDQIKQGRVSLDNQCLIGKDAWRKSGSTMFLNYGDVVSIEELIKGLLAVSGNDASIALAESTAGGIDKFVALMNLKAHELGLRNSHFQNPHGLNQEGHYMSLRDLGTVILHIYQDFPQYAQYLSIHEFTYRDIKQYNHNPLFQKNYDGVIGGKTGFTGDGGYGVVASVKRNNRRLIAVVNKTRTPRQRSAIITELFDYGFDKYKKLTLFEKNKPIAKLKTWMGNKNEIEVFANQEISFNLPRDEDLNTIKVKVSYNGPIQAPIAKGSKIATLNIELKNHQNFEYSLFAQENIDKSSFLTRIRQRLSHKLQVIASRFGFFA